MTPQSAFPTSDPYLRYGSSPGGFAISPEQKPSLPVQYKPETRTASFESGVRPFSASLSPTTYRQNSIPSVRTSIEGPGVSVATTQFNQPVSSPELTVSNFDILGNLALSTSSTGLATAGVLDTTGTSMANAIARSLATFDSMTEAYGYGETSSVDLTAGYAFPLFGLESYNRSPVAVDDAQFSQWVFDQSKNMGSYAPASDPIPGHIDIVATQMQLPSYSDRHFNTFYSPNPMNLMHVTDATTTTLQTCLSEAKRTELLDIIRSQFTEREQDAVGKCKDRILGGNPNDPDHLLGSSMLHSYIGSYFFHQHTQLPILHLPTFDANKVPNLLLLIVIAIGAATLDRAYGDITRHASEFANFLAWHIRWEIVRDEGYRPPAKLWVFQTLILLEVYEKMYSTRALHERAHINHDTTLTLMRRGTSFIGKGGSDSPGSLREARTERSSGSTAASEMPSDDTWRNWIRNEETRRIAFAAFVLDSIHATMFGHSAKMVAYEVRLPLPCDEALWSAQSASEVARVQSSHQTNGIKPIMFLEGLKKTIRGERVRTNSFGRTILMSGLLSVNYLLNQRDLQASVLNFSGQGTSWHATVMKAFDHWKRDFDATLEETHPRNSQVPALSDSIGARRLDGDNIFESRIVLHHLAHMASCVDIVDCQTFAGANRLLGRPIGSKELDAVRKKMTNWVKSSQARDATFYGLKFLTQVLLHSADSPGHATILPHAFDHRGWYLARDDFLMHRPWVLYFSSLVVWSYGFALEGPLSRDLMAEVNTEDPDDAHRDMKLFLDRVGQLKTPDDLKEMKGMNRCLGMLAVLKNTFASTRWQLTREAAVLLEGCMLKLKGVKKGSEGGKNQGPEVLNEGTEMGVKSGY